MTGQPEDVGQLIAESESIQNFLKAVYHLQQGLERVPTNALAEVLQISAPSVTDMAQRLGTLDLVDYRKHKGSILTGMGEREALKIIRRHRLIETYLERELGYAPYEVHKEAEKMEHAVSDHFINAIARKLGHPRFDPHGEPIPAVDGSMVRRELIRLSKLPTDTPAIVARYGTNDAPQLRHIIERGLTMETHIQVIERDPFDGPLTLLVGQTKCVIGYKIADLIFVELQT